LRNFRIVNSISATLRKNRLNRVATYYRVSTGRQLTTEASIPSQQKITAGFCDQNDYLIVDEFVEAKTATDDRRPVLQEMIDRACAPDHPYDAIVFYARFDASSCFGIELRKTCLFMRNICGWFAVNTSLSDRFCAAREAFCQRKSDCEISYLSPHC
jgi:hypothetical protein